MAHHKFRRASLVIPLVLATLAACTNTETVAPKFGAKAHLAQGDNNTWTVTNTADPGDGTCDDSDCTLREAIAAAANGGQVVFAPGVVGAINLTAGELAIVDKDLSIHGDRRITVDAQKNSRVLLIRFLNGPRPDVTLTGITLKNGYVDGDGAGIRVSSGRQLTLDNVTLDGNESLHRGGGVFLIDADAFIRNTSITNNKAQESGGGMYIFNGPILVENTTVSGNTATLSGGGIWNAGSLTFRNGTVSGNSTSEEGGGFYIDGNSTMISSSTISGNSAGGNNMAGGGILVVGAALAIRNSTIVANFRTGSGHVDGLMVLGATGKFGTATLANTILGGNGSSDCGIFDNFGTARIVSLGYNVINTVCFFGSTALPTDVNVSTAQVFTEVLEQQLKDNGGPTRTHALIARGRAIDAGYCPGETSDQRGFARPVDVAAMPNALDACDVGAYEAQGPQVAVADLMVSQSVDKATAKQGEIVTYTVRVRNLGPQTAPNVVLTNVLSSGVTFVEARVNNGTTTAPPKGETGTVTWNLGNLVDQSNEAAEIVVKVLVRGKTTITNTATVTGDVADPNTANNTASIKVSVAAGGSGGGPPPKK